MEPPAEMEQPAEMDPAGVGTRRSAAARVPRRRLARALADSLLIVLSVLLALGVDEWRDQRTRHAGAEMALRSMGAELRENAGSVERARTHHLAMRDSLQGYLQRRQAPPPHVYLSGLFNPALVHATAWDSARETGATSDLPLELVLALSRVYDRQARYRTLGDALVQDLMSQIRREGMEGVLRDRYETFIPLQLDFANRESDLLRSYEVALADLARGPDAFRSAGRLGDAP
jgi:hypothetical protein